MLFLLMIPLRLCFLYCINTNLFLSFPSLSNLTFPSTNANNVSSLPIPTFVPGWNFVPLCLTRIFPTRTNCPSALFSPRRFDSLPLPFLTLPWPWLQDMVRDIEDGKVTAVIVKDLSRIGRNYINVGEFIEKYI